MAKRKGSRKASAKKKLRYAFIGAGGIAGAHMRYLKDMEDVEMVAMADISKPGMETKAEQFGIDGIYMNYPDHQLIWWWIAGMAALTPLGLIAFRKMYAAAESRAKEAALAAAAEAQATGA